MSESFTLSTAGTALSLTDRANGIEVIQADFPPPDRSVLYASSIDTEGGDAVARKWENRQIPLTVRCFDVTAGGGQMDLRVKQLQQVCGRISYEGGTLTRVSASGTINFDVEDINLKVPLDHQYVVRKNAMCEVNITARPLGYGTEVALSDHTETTLPVLTFTEASIAGDVPALGRLVVDNDQSGQNQRWLQWGVRSRNYGTATSNALFYEAETRLRQGGAILAARVGASGGTVVRQGTLTTSYQSMLSLASSGTAYLSHVGRYEVMGRVFDPGGTVGNVELALQWSQGDFVNATTNDPVSASIVGDFAIVDFGQVSLNPAVTGAQRWDGQIIAKGTGTNQSVDVDCVWLVPIDEGSGRVTASSLIAATSTILARDDFTGIASGTGLNTRTAPLGGAWATTGATTDFAASDNGFSSGSEEETRATAGDTFPGRLALLGTTNMTDTEVDITILWPGSGAGQFYQSAIARGADTSNYLRATIRYDQTGLPTTTVFEISTAVAAAGTVLKAANFGSLPAGIYTIRLIVYANGRVIAYLLNSSGGTVSRIEGSSTALATGGALQSGKPGFMDYSTVAVTRRYDNFSVGTPAAEDAAVYALQSLELRSDRCRREDSSGVAWANLDGRYQGQYLLVPASGQEGRTSQMIVKMSRGIPDSLADSGIDDLSAQLFVTPRWLNVPES